MKSVVFFRLFEMQLAIDLFFKRNGSVKQNRRMAIHHRLMNDE